MISISRQKTNSIPFLCLRNRGKRGARLNILLAQLDGMRGKITQGPGQVLGVLFLRLLEGHRLSGHSSSKVEEEGGGGGGEKVWGEKENEKVVENGWNKCCRVQEILERKKMSRKNKMYGKII